MDTAPPFALYNPALLPPDVLLSEFVARRPLLARLLDIIRSNDPGEPPQHVLCVGPRGMGKTTLLCAVAATIKLKEPDLAEKWQPVVFDEESRRVGDLADFWLECIRQWESETEPSLVRSHRIDALLAKPGPDIEDQARDVFLSLVDASGKRALLLIDNLNDIFVAVNDVESLMRLRSFLMSDPRVMIIGAATRWFSDVTGLDKPFFEFFRPFDLHALSLEEMRECLAGIANARGDERVLETLRDRPGSIEVLHILTGGNPRLIRTFYRLLNEGMNGELRLQIERLIDDYTPYHKAIIDALPGQQQRVLDAIALEWNPCEVSTVARATRLPSNQVSSQIKALIKAGLISEAPNLGNSKRKSYLLTDRFSNIHYLMRHGRTGKTRMKWFVMMLRALFGDKEFAEAAARLVRMTASGEGSRADESLMLAQNVMDYAGSESARRAFMDRMMGAKEFDKELDVSLAEKICRQAIAANPEDSVAYYKFGRLLAVHLNRDIEAEAAYRRAIELNPSDPWPLNGLGNLFSNYSNRRSEAEAAYRKAIEIDSNFAFPWFNLGRLYTLHLGRYEEAEAAYRKAIELAPTFGEAWTNLGLLLTDYLQRYDEAEIAYRRAIEADVSLTLPWTNLGILLYQKLQRYDEAEDACRKAIEIDPNLALSWNLLGILLAEHSKRYEEAEAAFSRALELNAMDPWHWNNLGNLLNYNLERYEEAETAYRRALEIAPLNRKARPNLARLLFKLDRIPEAFALTIEGLIHTPSDLWAQDTFRELCFSHAESLQSVLPSVSAWCIQNPSEQDVLSFMIDAWIAYAKVTSSTEARELLDSQPDEVKLAFETVRDAFLAHDDKDHLHRLAPERRAPVLKMLEMLE